LEQLDELWHDIPKLIDETEFVEAYIRKLAPHAGINIDTDLAAREEYITRVCGML